LPCSAILISKCSLTAIQERNRALFKARSYRGQGSSLGHYRYLIRSYDTASLYRQSNIRDGINIKQKPERNIHDWFDPSSLTFNQAIRDVTFHYVPRTSLDARLEVGLATADMMRASWDYAHGKQILLDGTFGVCDRRMLLFILMAVDERNHGVPLAFLLFSAPGGNKATAAGYNTAILVKMIRSWQSAVEKFGSQCFEPAVAITDTDFKERRALLSVFPRIILLICKFHLRQSWRNHRNKVLKDTAQAKSEILERLKSLETQLIASSDWDFASELVLVEREALSELATDKDSAAMVGKAQVHVDYLSSYWLSEALYHSWSEYGRIVAAQQIGTTFEGVVSTTNPLESFNGVLKHKHLGRWSRGGHRIRVDALVNILALKVPPSIFEQRRVQQEEREMLRVALASVPGGAALMSHGFSQSQINHHYLTLSQMTSGIEDHGN
jgi:hypothetical protein